MTDAESGLLNMRARYYHPWIGRFASPDPIGFSGGLNWYAYANGNPINFADPTGYAAQDGQSQYTSFADYLGIAFNRNGMVLVMEHSAQVVESSRNHGVNPNLVAATIMFEHRGWGLIPGSQYAEAALSYGKSVVNPLAQPTYGFAQLGPEARAKANLSVGQSLTAEGSIEGAAAWLSHKKQELINGGIANPSDAQIATRYNVGDRLPIGTVTGYGKNVGAIINEVKWNFPKSNK
jgi:RHS repeat-associated protein